MAGARLIVEALPMIAIRHDGSCRRRRGVRGPRWR